LILIRSSAEGFIYEVFPCGAGGELILLFAFHSVFISGEESLKNKQFLSLTNTNLFVPVSLQK
jgi:hypothetical protein